MVRFLHTGPFQDVVYRGYEVIGRPMTPWRLSIVRMESCTRLLRRARPFDIGTITDSYLSLNASDPILASGESK
jgi:hypothetical protein